MFKDFGRGFTLTLFTLLLANYSQASQWLNLAIDNRDFKQAPESFTVTMQQRPYTFLDVKKQITNYTGIPPQEQSLSYTELPTTVATFDNLMVSSVFGNRLRLCKVSTVIYKQTFQWVNLEIDNRDFEQAPESFTVTMKHPSLFSTLRRRLSNI